MNYLRGIFNQLLGRPAYYVIVVFLFLLLFVPLVTTDPFILGVLVLANIYAVFATSWDILSGYTGKENFGHALFIGAGAYAAAYLNTLLGVSPWVNLLLGGLVGAIFGFLIGLPCLPLTGPYLALATVAAAGIAERLTLIFSEYTGGEEGLYGLEPFTNSPVSDFYLSLFLLILTVILLMAIGYSKRGLLLRSILFDEAAAEASGIDTTRYKLGAFVVSAFFAGVAGAFYAHYQMYTGPAYLSIILSISVIIMSIVGGIGTIVGPVLGAYLLTILNEFLRAIGDLRLLVYSGLLVVILLFLPSGIFATIIERLPRKSLTE
jgi:branched-chain amino acid transport system permease protein